MKYVSMDGVKALERQKWITQERVKMFFETEDIDNIIISLLRSVYSVPMRN